MSLPTLVSQLPHGDMQRHDLDSVPERIPLSPRINHPLLDRLDVVARTVKAALYFGRGAAFDLYRPMLAAGPGQQKINCCTGVATAETGGVASVDETSCRLQIKTHGHRERPSLFANLNAFAIACTVQKPATPTTPDHLANTGPLHRQNSAENTSRL